MSQVFLSGMPEPPHGGGVCPIALELGVLDLCWTHVQGIDPSQAGPSLLAANGGVPRGLIKGSG